MTDTTNSADILDVRDLIERFEELEGERESLQEEADEARKAHDAALDEAPDADTDLAATHEERAADLAQWDEDNGEEYESLRKLLEELRGYGGDHQWKGDWYPSTLIRDSYFVDYAQGFLEDIGVINKNADSILVIDWEATAENIQQDYSSVDYDGETYWYR